LVFNSSDVKPLFSYFYVSGTFTDSNKSRKNTMKSFHRNKYHGHKNSTGRPREAKSGPHGADRYPCRVVGAYLVLVRHVPFVFLPAAPHCGKTYTIIFPRFTEAAGEARVFVLLRDLYRGGIDAIVITNSSIA
jgi:hypothetical protein